MSTPPKDKNKDQNRVNNATASSKNPEAMPLVNALMNYLAEFGAEKKLKRTRVKVGDVEAEIEFPDAGAQPSVTAPAPSALTPAAPQAATGATVLSASSGDHNIADIESNPAYKIVRSPLVGTFYRSSTPDRDPFVEVGDTVKKGQPVAVIEAMKMFNEVESEFTGTVVKILTENEAPVEYNQALFVISV